jgi:LysR family nitrogen assimilation transcriptional regulator
MQIRQLRYFVLIADVGSIAQASAHSGTTAPAISRAIAALEQDLGCALFERDGRGMRLTEAGETLRARATLILRDLELARQEAAAQSRSPTGEVLIGASPSVVSLLGARLIRAAEAAFPEVRPRVSEGYSAYLQNWALTGVVDFALANGFRPSHARLDCVPLAVERLHAVGRAGALPEGRIALSDLLDARLLLPSRQNPIRDLLDRAAASLGRAAPASLEIDSARLLMDLAAEGRGLAVLPFAAVAREVAAGRLSAVPIVEPEVISPLNLIHLKDRPPSRVASALIRLVVAALEEIVASDDPHGYVEVTPPERYRA